VRDQTHDELETNQVVDEYGQFAAVVASGDDEREASDALLFGKGIDEPLENMDDAQDWMVTFISTWTILLKLFTPMTAAEYDFAANENE
jgi:hypothetical protein